MQAVAFFLVHRLENPIAEVIGLSAFSHFCVRSCTCKSSLFILNICSPCLIQTMEGEENPCTPSCTFFCCQDKLQAMELWQLAVQELDRLKQNISDGKVLEADRQQLQVVNSFLLNG